MVLVRPLLTGLGSAGARGQFDDSNSKESCDGDGSSQEEETDHPPDKSSQVFLSGPGEDQVQLLSPPLFAQFVLNDRVLVALGLHLFPPGRGRDLRDWNLYGGVAAGVGDVALGGRGGGASLSGVKNILVILESVVSNAPGTLVDDHRGGVAGLAHIVCILLLLWAPQGKVLFGVTFWQSDGFYGRDVL